MTGIFYGFDSEPIDFDAWVQVYEEKRDRHVALDKILGPDGQPLFLISTTWFGMDYSWGEDPRPLIFESMVFAAVDSDRKDLEQWRYATWDEAVQGHNELLRKYTSDPDTEP